MHTTLENRFIMEKADGESSSWQSSAWVGMKKNAAGTETVIVIALINTSLGINILASCVGISYSIVYQQHYFNYSHR